MSCQSDINTFAEYLVTFFGVYLPFGYKVSQHVLQCQSNLLHRLSTAYDVDVFYIVQMIFDRFPSDRFRKFGIPDDQSITFKLYDFFGVFIGIRCGKGGLHNIQYHPSAFDVTVR